MANLQGNRASTIAALVLCLALVSCQAQIRGRGVGGRGVARRGNGLGPRVGEKVFNILQFGAKADGRTDSTEAVGKAWIAACRNTVGFARVYIPPGVFKISAVIFGGPCKSTSPVFQISGTLKADSDLSNYPDKGWISFERVDGLVIMGLGTVDAQGNNVWQYNDCRSNSDCVHLPSSLYLNGMRNTKISGIHLLNSMGFHMHITQSYNVRMSGLKITAPQTSPNTDGMHISHSQIVKVGRSLIRTGDDCISIGQGANNVTISKIFCGPGHGISIGSLGKLPNEENVSAIRVKNCTLTGTDNGLRIKTWPGSGPSKASGILFTDIVMNNVKNPIIIDQGYGKRSAKPSRVKITDVTYQNVRGTSATPMAVNLMCSKIVPCDNLHFANINLKFGGLHMPVNSFCTNAKAGFSGIQIPPACRSI